MAPVSGAAHPLAPALLSLDPLPGGPAGHYQVTWKVPLSAPVGVRLEPVLPDACEQGRVAPPVQEGTGLVSRFELLCPGSSLAGLEIGVRGLVARGAGAVVRVAGGDGPVFQQVVTAAAPLARIPARPTRAGVGLQYAGLGIRHLVFGLDHVLFVLGLLALVTGRRSLLFTITAFTLGHSVTLSLAALGFVRAPTAWVEVAIAVTLVATALEIVPRERGRSLFGRAPWRVAFVFGLLHGLGFAGALAAIGLPVGEIPLALLAFNFGIEIGQLGVVAAALTLHFLVARARVAVPAVSLRWAAAYGLGGLSAYWLFERLGAAL